MHINSAEEEMMTLKLRYEQCIKERNMVGVHLLDRNDELCILYERLNVQKEVMAKGESALVDKEDEIRKLSLIVAELKRKVELQKQTEPLVGVYEGEIEKLEASREKLRKKVADLAEEMENPDDPRRCRNLGGVDPSQKELLKKIERLEDLLAGREEKLLEKDLILEEIGTLTDRLKSQTLEGKDETYQVSRRLNDLTKRIKHVTKCMMAKVSELAMHQALAMSLYQEKSEKEALVEEAKRRLETEDIPTEQIERDFVRSERARIRREAKVNALKERKQREEAGRFVDMCVAHIGMQLSRSTCACSTPRHSTDTRPHSTDILPAMQRRRQLLHIWQCADHGRAASQCVHPRCHRIRRAADSQTIRCTCAVQAARDWVAHAALQTADRQASRAVDALTGEPLGCRRDSRVTAG
ncbi:hypothetical protein BC831DRAFT_173547 [Entophlyctis helioformis]|nr:hypothetical protein BC831DRAFT_173547 [Entophlyctis helioformis]